MGIFFQLLDTFPSHTVNSHQLAHVLISSHLDIVYQALEKSGTRRGRYDSPINALCYTDSISIEKYWSWSTDMLMSYAVPYAKTRLYDHAC